MTRGHRVTVHLAVSPFSAGGISWGGSVILLAEYDHYNMNRNIISTNDMMIFWHGLDVWGNKWNNYRWMTNMNIDMNMNMIRSWNLKAATSPAIGAGLDLLPHFWWTSHWDMNTSPAQLSHHHISEGFLGAKHKKNRNRSYHRENQHIGKRTASTDQTETVVRLPFEDEILEVVFGSLSLWAFLLH